MLRGQYFAKQLSVKKRLDCSSIQDYSYFIAIVLIISEQSLRSYQVYTLVCMYAKCIDMRKY